MDQQPLPNSQTPPQQATVAPTAKPVPQEDHTTRSRSHKGLIMALLVFLAVAVVGISAFIGFDSGNQYQGYLKQLDQGLQQQESPAPPLR